MSKIDENTAYMQNAVNDPYENLDSTTNDLYALYGKQQQIALDTNKKLIQASYNSGLQQTAQQQNTTMQTGVANQQVAGIQGVSYVNQQVQDTKMQEELVKSINQNTQDFLKTGGQTTLTTAKTIQDLQQKQIDLVMTEAGMVNDQKKFEQQMALDYKKYKLQEDAFNWQMQTDQAMIDLAERQLAWNNVYQNGMLDAKDVELNAVDVALS